MCFRVDVTYKCGHTETLLKPYSAAGHPRCRRVQPGQSRPGHIDTTDTRRREADMVNACLTCCYIDGERWAPLSSVGSARDAEIVMLDTYLRTESFKVRNRAIHEWVLEAVDMHWIRVAGGGEFELREDVVGAAVKRLELDREKAIEEVALEEIGAETRTDRNSAELDDIIVEIMFDREKEGPGSKYRLQQCDDRADII